jgi:CRP-like cAMP-binding protein
LKISKEILQSCSLFQDLSEEELAAIMKCIKVKTLHFSKDEYILRAGETTEFIGLILSGSAFMIQEDLWGERNIIAPLRTGDFFAEIFAAKPGAVLNTSVVAATDCQVYAMNINLLLRTCPNSCDRHHRIIRNLVTVLANKTLLLNDKITHVSKRKTRDKLLSYLSSEAVRQGSLSFTIPYNRQQLADFLCVERAAMCAELSKLQDEGILKTDHSHFELFTNVATIL